MTGGGVQRFDHVGVVVDDLELVTAFFVDLGFERGQPMRLQGEWIDRIIGLNGVQTEVVFVNAPEGSGQLELVKYHRPADPAGTETPLANRVGLRHLAYVVDDLDSIVARLRAKGLDTIGDTVNYQDIYRLCYIRGPEGLIVELAERLGAASGQTV